MRHRVFGKHLGRSVGQRNALRRTLITQFLRHERITTTRAKAEAIRGAAEHVITKAKRSLYPTKHHPEPDSAYAIHVRRLLAGRLDDKSVVTKVFDVLAPRYKEREGGYTRMLKLGPRQGDAAEMVILELVDRDTEGGATAASGAKGVAGRARGLFSRIRGSGASKPAEASKTEGGES